VEETLKTIRFISRMFLVVSAAALTLLLSPKGPDYDKALEEATVLLNLDDSGYADFVSDRMNTEALLAPPWFVSAKGKWITSWSMVIYDYGDSTSDSLFRTVPTQESTNSSFTFEKFVLSEPGPIQGNLQDWLDWIVSTRPARYLRPRWSGVVYRQVFDAELAVEVPLESGATRKVVLVDSSHQRANRPFPPAGYRFHLISPIESLSYNNHRRWIVGDTGSLAARMFERQEGFQQLIKDLRDSAVTHVKLSGAVGVEIDSLGPNIDFGSWLRQTDYWRALSDSESPMLLPGLMSVWSEVKERNLVEAIKYMEHRESRGRIFELFGQQIYGRYAMIAIPFAFLALQLYLLPYLRFVHANMSNCQSRLREFPWIGILGDTFSYFMFRSIHYYIPLALVLWLAVIQYFELGLWWYVSSFTILFGVSAIDHANLRLVQQIRVGIDRRSQTTIATLVDLLK